MTQPKAMDKIYVIDDIVPMTFKQELYSLLLRANWNYGGVSNHPLETHRTWHFIVKNFKDGAEKNPNAFLNQYLEALWRHHIGPLVSKFFHYTPTQIGLHHVYGNLISLGDVSPIHRDAQPEEKKKMITAIFYPNLEWSPEWGAETIFVNEEQTDIVRSVSPRPGRLLLFDAVYYHAMRQPTRVAPVPRMSLAYKIEIINDPNADSAKH